MQKPFPNFFLLILLGSLLLGCSTSKNKLINREYHTLNTRYNVLFNGQEALAIGESILEQVHQDNFYELLPVEPLTLEGENFDETTIVPGFDRAEEKAVKAIQKHSMNINNEQYNRQIDDAYLLLGKARYYDRRFFPALEAFNFLLESNAALKTYNTGRIWREKTNIRLRNNDLAIENLRPFVRTLSPKSTVYGLAHATLAEAFINIRQWDSAVAYIKKAAIYEKDKRKRARYLFISGQLHETLEAPDEAIEAYTSLIAQNRKIPRKYWINAQLKYYQLTATRDSLPIALVFEPLLKNYENNPFQHRIYRTMGRIALDRNQDSIGQVYLNRSLRSPAIDKFTKIYNYRDLVALQFTSGAYVKAGKYLDSLIPLYDSGSLAQKRTQRRRDNLDEVIAYEETVRETDSLLHLMGLSKADQLAFFETALEKKRQAEQQAAAAKAERKGGFLSNSRNRSNFYFYNPSLLVQGKQQFLATWGNRPNVDGWRSAVRLRSVAIVDSVKTKSTQAVEEILVESAASYVNRLPNSERERDSLREDNHRAYLQLGLIYKEKYKNNALAIARLTHLLSQNPNKKLIPPALYHLYRIYENSETEKANDYKLQLVKSYPETPFARIITDFGDYNTADLQTPDKQYGRLYALFEAQQFSELIQQIEALLILNSGTSFEPKLKLLNANAIGRLYGITEWKNALEKLVDEHPKATEGAYAKSLLVQINATNDLDEKGKKYANYKWVIPFEKKDSVQSKQFYDAFVESLTVDYPQWRVSLDSYDNSHDFVVVHGVRNPRKVNDWLKSKGNEKETVKKSNYFVVLATDLRDIFKNKTWKNITIK